MMDEQVTYFNEDTNIFIEDQYDEKNSTKYKDINKILAEVDTPYPD